ncbi:MAG TPA: YfhO family protein [Patescibacteria group bacterium]
MKILRNFLPIIFIFLLWFIFASPYFILGRAPFAADYQVNNFSPWDMYSQFAQPVKNGAMPDVITQIYPWKNLVINIWKSGEIPLWNSYSFGGTPLLANYQSAVLSPFNILFFVLPFVDGWSLLVLLQPLLAGLGMYIFARRVGISKLGALLSSISFMFCGFIVVWMGYGTLGYALLFLPYALYGLESYFLFGKVKYLIFLALSLPLSFFSGHFQISLYFLIVVIAYWIYKTLEYKSLRKSFFSLIYIFFGFLICLPQILPSLEFYTQSLRSGLFQKGEVIPLSYLPTILAPDFLGNPVTRNDWFGHYAEWNTYIGVIPFFLALLSLSYWKKSIIKFSFIAGLIALVLALNTPIADIFVALHIPVLSTSALSRVVSIHSFFFALLGGFGLDRLQEVFREKKKMGMGLILIFGSIVFVVLWSIVLGKLFLPLEKIIVARQNLILSTILFLGLILTTISGYLLPNRFRKYVILILILTTAFDMYRFASKWQAFDPKSLVAPYVRVVSGFEKIQGNDRSLGNYGAEISNLYRLPSLEGYDALYPKRFGEFVSYVSDGYLHEADRSVVSFPRNGKFTSDAINLLDVKYIIHKVADTNRGWTFQYWKYPSSQFSLLFNDGIYQIFSNNNAFPHAFLVGNYLVKTSQKDILNTLFGGIDQKNSIVLEAKPKIKIGNDENAKAIIKKYNSGNILIQTSAKSNMMLFLSDNYYPGWKAYVDGVPTPIYRADYTFRAVEVPKGDHTVIFSYQPNSFYIGLIGCLFGFLGIISLGILLRRLK